MPYKNVEDSNRWKSERYRDIVEWLRDYKLQRGCVDCGYREHHAALEFDHRPEHGKAFNLGNAGTRSFDLIKKEIAKCDVRCSNCHSIRTWERQQEALAIKQLNEIATSQMDLFDSEHVVARPTGEDA